MPTLAAAAQAGASIINNTVSNLFETGVKNAQKALVNAQKDLVYEQGRLDQLLNAQNYQLDQVKIQGQLANDYEKNLLDANATVYGAGATAQGQILSTSIQSSNSSLILITCIIGGILLLGGGIYFITKQD